MSWIKSESEIQRNPKFGRAARALGISKAALIGHLHMLWWWAVDYAQDGVISAYDDEDIAEAIEWKGDIKRFIDVLVNCGGDGHFGLLERTKKGEIIIHSWEEHCSNKYEKRKKEADRIRAYREKNKQKEEENKHRPQQDLSENEPQCTDDVRRQQERTDDVHGGDVRPEDERTQDVQVENVRPEDERTDDVRNADVRQENREERIEREKKIKKTPPVPGGGVFDVPANTQNDGDTENGKATQAPSNESTQAAEEAAQDVPAENSPHSEGARPNTDGNDIQLDEASKAVDANAPSEKDATKSEPYEQDFEAFYSFYPRRVHRKEALKAFQTLMRKEIPAGDVIHASETYGKVMRWRNTPMDRILHPATFLHEERWRDWLPPDGASYLEAKELAMRQKNGNSKPKTEATPMTYEEAIAKYGDIKSFAEMGAKSPATAIDVPYRMIDGSENYDARTGLQALY